MKEPLISDRELKKLMAEHLRRSLEDELMKGSLPPRLAQAIEESPEEVVDLVMMVLAPAAIARTGDHTVAQNEKAAKTALTPDEVHLLIQTLVALQVADKRDVDVDLDGALLFCKRGKNMLKTERYSDAKRYFERAIEIKSAVKAAWQGLAEAQEKLGETDAAEESRQRASLL